jgi:peptidoglycan/xylan/chitin deacetylase (PgdA/CDA1 family)
MKYRYRPRKRIYKCWWFYALIAFAVLTCVVYAQRGDEIRQVYASMRATTAAPTVSTTFVPAKKTPAKQPTTAPPTTQEFTVDPDKPMVALTFDDGPGFEYEGSNSTERILKVLEKYNARATFFMVGDRINDETAYLLKKEVKLGCELGNHTYNHKHYGEKVTAKDISKASSAIKKCCGKAPTIFRCPGGNVTKVIEEECKKEKMPLAHWSVDTQDWKSHDAKKIYKRTMDGVYDGAIILMHDIYEETADAVEKIVPELVKRGYQVVTVSEMIEAKSGKPPKPGQQYKDWDSIDNNTN